MGRERPALGTPFGTDGPWLAAILGVLDDLYDMLDDRLPQADASGEPVPVKEPAPQRKPAEAVPVQEPAPVVSPQPEGDEDENEPAEVAEPAPASKPPLPPPPPRAGRGSGLDAWQAFANVAEVVYAPDAGRNDIIAACERAGVIDTE